MLRAELATSDPSDYFLLLNADTIMRPGALASLLEAAEARPDVGIVSPRLEWPDGEGQPSCFRDWRPSDEFLIAARTGVFSELFGRSGIALPVLDSPAEVEWTSFACALIRWDVLQEVGVLDDGFFLYYDDPDYCRRARQAGWKVLHWPAARVVHLRGPQQSGQGNDRPTQASAGVLVRIARPVLCEVLRAARFVDGERAVAFGAGDLLDA